MTAVLILSAGLIAITALSYAGAERLRAPASVLLVLMGIAASLIPHAPKVEIDPELVLLFFLPPLIYASGVGMSWRGFRDNLQPILLLAIGCVLFTALAVAAAAHWLLGMPFAVALVMGAVVSPPDPVAPVALARRLKMPVRLLTVLEGEGLVNDATALILLSFGVQAVSAGGLSLTDAALRFILIVAGEIVWGLLAAFAALRLRARMNDPQSEITLALLTPFLAFWPPHMLGGSGVLAALAAGLYVSWHGPRFISPATRIQGFFVWGLVTHVLEGVLFLLIGLQARGLADALGRGDAHRLILAVALTGFVVVAARFIWIYPASALPRFIAARLGRKTPATEPGSAFLIAFTGIRGAVSLAGAFSIPALVHERAFPERELILFVTFCVIVLTLVGQGSLLPMVLRRLGLVALGEAEAREERRREVMARIKGVEAALERLDQAEQSGAPAPVVRLLRRRHEDRLQSYRRAAEKAAGHPVSDPSRLHVVLIEAERARLAELYAAKAFGDEARRRMERELDLQHALSRHSAESATGRSFDELL